NMNKYPFLKNLEFEDIEEHIELFCEKKTDDGYQVRGQVFALPELNLMPDEYHEVWEIQYFDDFEEEIKDYKIYLITILVLTNYVYQKRLKDEIIEKKYFNPEFGFLGNNEYEFSPFLQYYKKLKNTPMTIDMSEIKLKDSYISNLTKQGKDIILLDIDFGIFSPSLESPSQSYSSKKIYPFLVEHYSDYSSKEVLTFANFFVDSIHKTLYDVFNYRDISRYKYNEILMTIGNLGYEWINKK
ncbi:unnamed protein product, partial [marine sediment metagenome]